MVFFCYQNFSSQAHLEEQVNEKLKAKKLKTIYKEEKELIPAVFLLHQ